MLAFLTIPIAAIFLEAGPAELWDALGEEITLDALRLSLFTSVTALAIIVVVGTPAAYLLATRNSAAAHSRSPSSSCRSSCRRLLPAWASLLLWVPADSSAD